MITAITSYYNTTHSHTTAYEEQDNTQRKGEGNSGQKINVNKKPVSRYSDNKDDGQDNVIRTRYRRVIRKLDRLAY